jgi:hypothetical protein
VTLNRFSQPFAGFSSLRYISMSAIVIGSFALSSSNVCLAKAFLQSALPTCYTAFGNITSINGQNLQIAPEQGSTIVNAEYSNATHFLKEEVVTSSNLKKGIDVKVLANTEAELVILDPSDQLSETPSLGCRIAHPDSQTTQRPTATPSSGELLGEPIIASQGTVQQITDNTFTILPHTGLPKTFMWAANTNFIQYTDYQYSQILSSGASVLLIGPIRNGVIIASRITVIPKAQTKGSLKQSCFLLPGTFVCDLIALAFLALII